MFCPSCGKEIPDNAKFCPKCGESFAGRGAPAPAGEPKKPKKPKKTAIALAAVAAVLVLVAILVAPGLLSRPQGAQSTQQSSQSVSSTVQSSGSSELQSGGSAESQSTAATGSASQTGDGATLLDPDKQFEVTDLKLSTDSQNRPYITGTVTSKASEAYDVPMQFSIMRHKKDAYSEETARKLDDMDFCLQPATPMLGASTVTTEVCAYNLEPGERRNFTLYPIRLELGDGISYSDPAAEFGKANSFKLSKPIKGSSDKRHDNGEYFEVTNVEYANGVVKGTYVNKTDTYFSKATLGFTACTKQGEPLARTGGNQGIVTPFVEIKNIEPGARGTFEEKVYAANQNYEMANVDHLDYMDVQLEPDASKGGWR